MAFFKNLIVCYSQKAVHRNLSDGKMSILFLNNGHDALSLY